jgi:predicted nucleic acid-binding protein
MIAKRFLVDTTVWVSFLRGGNPALKERFTALAMDDRLLTCEVIIAEIVRGAKSDKEYSALRNDFAALPMLEITGAVWEECGKLGFVLKKAGVTAPLVDILIAATAMHHRCTLLHGDRHFDLIARQVPLKTASP